MIHPYIRGHYHKPFMNPLGHTHGGSVTNNYSIFIGGSSYGSFGHSHGGFWGSLGCGLGQGLSTLFCGLLGNMFGGGWNMFGMNSMYSMPGTGASWIPMPSPMSYVQSFGPASASGCNCGCGKTGGASKTDKPDEKEKTEYEKLNKKFEELKNDKNPTKQMAQNLYKDINKAIKSASDDDKNNLATLRDNLVKWVEDNHSDWKLVEDEQGDLEKTENQVEGTDASDAAKAGNNTSAGLVEKQAQEYINNLNNTAYPLTNEYIQKAEEFADAHNPGNSSVANGEKLTANTYNSLRAAIDKAKERLNTNNNGNKRSANGTDNAGGTGAAGVTESGTVAQKVNVNGRDVPIGDITNKDVLEMIPNEIKGLNKETAKAILNNIGYLEESAIQGCDNSNPHGKLSGKYNILLLLQQSGLIVKCAHNLDLDHKNNADAWIVGKIENVHVDNDDKIHYDINCSQSSCSMFGLKYSVERLENNQIKVSYKEGTPKDGKLLYTKSQTYTMTSQDKGAEKRGESVISRRQGNGYEPIATN